MKRKPFLNVSIIVSILLPTLGASAQTKVNFSGDWASNPDMGFMQIHLVQKGATLSGEYSTSPYPDAKKVQDGKLKGTVLGNHARLKFTSSFAPSDNQKGSAELTLAGKKLFWHEVASPKGAYENYSPLKESLQKIDAKKVAAIQKQVDAGQEMFDNDGDPAAIEKLMRPVFSLRPRDFEAEVSYAQTLLNLKRTDQAIKILKNVQEYVDNERASVVLARAYLDTKNYVEAENKLQDCLDVDPTSSNLWMGLSDAQRHQNKTQAALTSAQKAVDLDSQNRNALINLGDICMFDAKFERASDAYRAALNLGELTEDSARLRALIASCDAEAANKQQFGADKDSYENLERTTTFQWKASDMPLKVYIESNNRSKTFRPEYLTILKDSFEQWSKASGGRIKFVYVNSKYLSNITCDFTENIKDVQTEASGAETTMVAADGSSLWANMHILTQLPDDVNPVNDTTMRHTCLHEIGHAIGLVKHSTVKTDIMFAFIEETPLAVLSKRDALTIQRLYSNLAPDKLPTSPKEQ